MAFMAAVTTQEAYTIVLRELRRAKATASARSAEISGGNVSARVLVNVMDAFVGHSAAISEAVSAPGIEQYARDQHNDQAYDVVAEANAARIAIDAVPAWLLTNLPTNSSGRPDLHVWAGSTLGWRTFTPAQTGPLVALLGVVDAAIAV